MLREFGLYDVFILSFVQLVVTMLLVLSPAREIGTHFRWTGSKITEVVVGALGALAVSALSCFLAAEIWGLPVGGLEMAAYLLTIFSVVVIVVRPDCGVVGQLFYAAYAAAGITFLAFAVDLAAKWTHSAAESVTASLVLLLDLGALVVWISNVNYVSDVLCRTRRLRPRPEADPSYLPMVSIHIPAYNEPPDLLIETIKSVERIDYPDFEVVVIDNNTLDPAVYGPVEDYCRDRERVRFVHVAPWPGYKAGACNLALRRYTDPRAEIIGLVDADDIVQPYYLRETVSYFSDPHLGFLQSFEGNRDFEGSAYYTACVDSYQSFYLTSMSSRNERDSVPFVGTMGLFRRSALEGIGGWNEWCISEDTEASLRMSKAGWSGLYVPRCFGRGVVPPSYAGLSTQRHRWCFGAMQIFRLHWRSLMPWDRSPDNHLSSAQRRDYLMACMGWTRDLMMLAFALVLIAIAGLSLTGSRFALMPLAGDKSLLPISLILIATVCTTWTLRYWTTMSHRRAVLGLVISLAASWVTALACIEGIARRDGVFLRTSKTGSSHHRLRTALRLSRWESLLAVSLYVSAGFLAASRRPPLLLIAIIVFQGTVYLCGPVASVWNLRAQRVPAHAYRQRFEQQRLRRANRGRASSGVLGPATAALLALGVGGMTGAIVAPVTLLRANAVHRTTVTAQTMLHSAAGTKVYVKLGTALSEPAPYYPVSSVRLSQPRTSSAGSSLRFSLSFETSSLALLDEVLANDVTGRGISALTLALRTPDRRDLAAKTEMTDTLFRAAIASFDENLTGAPTGSVALSLSSLGHVVTSPRGLGPFVGEPASSRAARTDAYVKLSSNPSKRAYYYVAAVELAQALSASPGQRARFSLSFDTSSLALLNDVLRYGGPGRRIPALTLFVREPSGGLTTTGTFYKAVVTSFDEDLSGSLAGRVTLYIR